MIWLDFNQLKALWVKLTPPPIKQFCQIPLDLSCIVNLQLGTYAFRLLCRFESCKPIQLCEPIPENQPLSLFLCLPLRPAFPISFISRGKQAIDYLMYISENKVLVHMAIQWLIFWDNPNIFKLFCHIVFLPAINECSNFSNELTNNYTKHSYSHSSEYDKLWELWFALP